jgi:predicted RNase H-like HicB family nuclease
MVIKKVYIDLPGPGEPKAGMAGAELLHGFLVELRESPNPEIRKYIEALCNKWNVHYRGQSKHRYVVIFEKANGNYSAYSPDLPGCIATGATRKEAEKNIKEAISFHIEGLLKDGLTPPEPASFTEYIEV